MTDLFAIGDLHLSLGEGIDKPMDIFGAHWTHHDRNLSKAWNKIVRPEDFVVVAGDISWAMKFDDARADLDFLHGLPGTKILIRGNHDLWWTGIQKMNRLHGDLVFLQNNAVRAGEAVVLGSRGWICPGTDGFDESDEKIYKRELLRLEMSLEHAAKLGEGPRIGVLHYPPTNDKLQPSGFTALFEQAGVRQVVYGHLHGQEAFKNGLQGSFNGVSYNLVSLDYLKFKPLLVYKGGY